ncbi:MAG: hypothetical protein WBI20_08835 [Burkholderiaceae bacterium]
MISVTESAAPVRFSPLFPQGSVSPPLVEANTARSLSLKDGQVVQALVQSQGDQLTLLLQGRLVGVSKQPDWEIGQRLSFQAQVLADGSVILHPLTGPPPAAALMTMPSAAGLAGATPFTLPGAEGSFSRLASLLYRQPGQPDLQQLLAPGGLDALLARVVQPNGLQHQWQAMRLLPGQLSPELIRLAVMAVMGSETSIARASKPASNDPKQLLHQLLAALGENADENYTELQQVKRAIADLDSAQLSALQAQRAGEMAITVQLPLANEEPVELVFERKAATSEQPAVLSVSVHANSADYGELWLKAELDAANQIDLIMWAAQDWVVAQAQGGVAELKQQLHDAGLLMRSFHAHQGVRPAPPLNTQVSAEPGVVLDLRV